jgi:hypothetical protein
MLAVFRVGKRLSTVTWALHLWVPYGAASSMAPCFQQTEEMKNSWAPQPA